MTTHLSAPDVQGRPAYEVRPWERGTYGVWERRTRGFAPDDVWLPEDEAQRRADRYNTTCSHS